MNTWMRPTENNLNKKKRERQLMGHQHIEKSTLSIFRKVCFIFFIYSSYQVIHTEVANDIWTMLFFCYQIKQCITFRVRIQIFHLRVFSSHQQTLQEVYFLLQFVLCLPVKKICIVSIYWFSRKLQNRKKQTFLSWNVYSL